MAAVAGDANGAGLLAVVAVVAVAAVAVGLASRSLVGVVGEMVNAVANWNHNHFHCLSLGT